MKLIFEYITIFLIYSIIGWLVESTFVTIQTKKITNRGFLIGPYCPIYGWGSLIMTLYLEPYKNNIITVFLLSVIICSILEYLTSYFMEKLFKTRWWDYSNKKFNLNGRICGENALLFGLGGVLIIYLVHPFITAILLKINQTILQIITIIILILFIIDTIISLNIVNKFKKTLTNIDITKDSTQDFTQMVRSTLTTNLTIFQNRLLKAFPNSDFKKITTLRSKLKDELKKKTNLK